MRIGIKVSPFNLKMRERRMELGYSQKTLAELCGVNVNIINAIECLRLPKHGDRTTRCFLAIARELGLELDELFPPEYLDAVEKMLLPRRQSGWLVSLEVSLEQLEERGALQLVPPTLEQIESRALQNTLGEELEKALETLTLRERCVIELRFGLKDGIERTLEEVAREMGFTRERVRQYETEALRRLRHPKRARLLRDFLAGE